MYTNFHRRNIKKWNIESCILALPPFLEKCLRASMCRWRYGICFKCNENRWNKKPINFFDTIWKLLTRRKKNPKSYPDPGPAAPVDIPSNELLPFSLDFGVLHPFIVSLVCLFFSVGFHSCITVFFRQYFKKVFHQYSVLSIYFQFVITFPLII